MNINQTITLFVGGGGVLGMYGVVVMREDCSLTFSLTVLRCAGGWSKRLRAAW